LYHSNSMELKYSIINQLVSYGIATNIENGQIHYFEKKFLGLQCSSLYLLRHAETIGTREQRFMSDLSDNATLTNKGISDIKNISDTINRIKFDYILYSSIARVKQTAKIINHCIGNGSNFIEVPWMKGINNAGWEEKKSKELAGEDKEDFFQREILHNIFAKSSKGCSWGEVLIRCIDLIEYINQYYKNKKILLVSQGSILIGLRIILHIEKKPWENYDAETFFGLKSSTSQDYGKLHYIYGNELFTKI